MMCNVNAYWSLQQSADLTLHGLHGLDAAGPACAPGPRAKGVRGQGGTDSQRGGQQPRICLAVLRDPQWDILQLSVLPLLMGREER